MSDCFDHEGDAYDCQMDMIDRGDWDEYEYRSPSYRSFKPASVTCKYCKNTGLFWSTHGGKWALKTSSGQLHQCLLEKSKAKKDELEFKRKVTTNLSIDQINELLRDAAREDQRY